jgi:hypothetical protein
MKKFEENLGPLAGKTRKKRAKKGGKKRKPATRRFYYKKNRKPVLESALSDTPSLPLRGYKGGYNVGKKMNNSKSELDNFVYAKGLKNKRSENPNTMIPYGIGMETNTPNKHNYMDTVHDFFQHMIGNKDGKPDIWNREK